MKCVIGSPKSGEDSAGLVSARNDPIHVYQSKSGAAKVPSGASGSPGGLFDTKEVDTN